jgi:hypothetical protein
MTDAHQRARLAHVELAGKRAYLELRLAEQREIVRRLGNRPCGDPIDRRRLIEAQTAMLRMFEFELRNIRSEESAALVKLREIKRYKDNPPVPGAAISLRPPPLPGPRYHIDVQYADTAREWVWTARPYRDERGADYIAETRSFPPDTDGCCRHKAAWLAKLLDGKVLLGRRTDEPDAGPHAVASVKINGAGWVLDHDKTWAAEDVPFREEEFNLR